MVAINAVNFIFILCFDTIGLTTARVSGLINNAVIIVSGFFLGGEET